MDNNSFQESKREGKKTWLALESQWAEAVGFFGAMLNSFIRVLRNQFFGFLLFAIVFGLLGGVYGWIKKDVYHSQMTVSYAQLEKKIYGDMLFKLDQLIKSKQYNSLAFLLGMSEKQVTEIKKIDGLNAVIGQFEIPLEVTEKVFEYAKSNGITTILNPAPAKIPADTLLDVTDWFIPNEVEFETISGLSAFEDTNLVDYSKTIKSNLIVTLGDKGAAYIENGIVKKISAPKVVAIDTTGAGDAFVGAFSYAIASNFTIEDSIKSGIERASDSVTRTGTQSSYSK